MFNAVGPAPVGNDRLGATPASDRGGGLTDHACSTGDEDRLAGHELHGVLDVTDEKSIAAAAEQVEQLDVLVNNAGNQRCRPAGNRVAPRHPSALLPDDGPTGGFFSWDGTVAPW